MAYRVLNELVIYGPSKVLRAFLSPTRGGLGFFQLGLIAPLLNEQSAPLSVLRQEAWGTPAEIVAPSIWGKPTGKQIELWFTTVMSPPALAIQQLARKWMNLDFCLTSFQMNPRIRRRAFYSGSYSASIMDTEDVVIAPISVMTLERQITRFQRYPIALRRKYEMREPLRLFNPPDLPLSPLGRIEVLAGVSSITGRALRSSKRDDADFFLPPPTVNLDELLRSAKIPFKTYDSLRSRLVTQLTKIGVDTEELTPDTMLNLLRALDKGPRSNETRRRRVRTRTCEPSPSPGEGRRIVWDE